MNTKAVIGIIIAVLILVGAFFFTHRASAPAPLPEAPVATTTEEAPTASAQAGTPTISQEVPKIVGTGAFDQATYTTSSRNPKLTGTANVTPIQVVIQDDHGVGIVGGMSVPVVNGHWQFTSTRALAPGVYTVVLGGVDNDAKATLIVTAI